MSLAILRFTNQAFSVAVMKTLEEFQCDNKRLGAMARR
jgi:hypothetical protein